MHALKHTAAGVLIGAATAAAILVVASPPQGLPIEVLPSPTPSPLTVYVSGAVAAPGLYTLPPGSRVSDAVTAAGGALEGANITQLNLAQRLIDGQMIQVDQVEYVSPEEFPEKSEVSESADLPIDLNSATQDQLEQLPGIGPAKANDIIAYRQKVGGFDTIEQIMEVSGIGPATFEKIKDYITVSPRN